MNRYEIKPEGLGEINIDLDENGDWVKWENVKHLLKQLLETSYNSDAKCKKEFGNVICDIESALHANEETRKSILKNSLESVKCFLSQHFS